MSAPRLQAWRCARGHLHLHDGPRCPTCGAALRAVRVAPGARIIAMTTVHMSPGGKPFVLGIAQTRCGHARTLCRVETSLRGTGHDAVWLHDENGVMVARAGRPTAGNRAGRATRGDSQGS